LKIAGVDIGGTEIKYCIHDTDKPFAPDTVKSALTHADKGGKAVVENMFSLLDGIGSFDRVGISTTGQINPETGVVIYMCENIPDYTGIRLADEVRARYGVPVVIENDVNAAILAEVMYGAAMSEDFVIGLAYGTGIGGAIFCGRKLFYGSGYSAGEFGHIITHAGGNVCGCGNKGCYEAYASTGALTRMASARFGESLNGREIVARRGDPRYDELISDWTDEVVYGLVSIVHIFNPYKLILGGGIMENEFILSTVSQKLIDSVQPNHKKLAVSAAVLGNAAGLRGAIHLAQILKV